jgi:hypothetical protein
MSAGLTYNDLADVTGAVTCLDFPDRLQCAAPVKILRRPQPMIGSKRMSGGIL